MHLRFHDLFCITLICALFINVFDNYIQVILLKGIVVCGPNPYESFRLQVFVKRSPYFNLKNKTKNTCYKQCWPYVPCGPSMMDCMETSGNLLEISLGGLYY
jgi:hypothetical protein